MKRGELFLFLKSTVEFHKVLMRLFFFNNIEEDDAYLSIDRMITWAAVVVRNESKRRWLKPEAAENQPEGKSAPDSDLTDRSSSNPLCRMMH